jgi:hypothetical protein
MTLEPCNGVTLPLIAMGLGDALSRREFEIRQRFLLAGLAAAIAADANID